MKTITNHAPGSGQLARLPRWLASIIRYVLHLSVPYMVASFSPYILAGLIYGKILPMVQAHPPGSNGLQYLLSHLMIFSFVPAFLTGLFLNAKYHHQAAKWVWAVPVGLLTVAFLFGPGMYPTTIWDSNFSEAFQYFFGGGFHIPNVKSTKDLIGYHDLMRVYAQLRFTMPAYSATAYSIGSWLGMSGNVRNAVNEAVARRAPLH